MKTRPAFAVILGFCIIALVYNIRSSRYADSAEQRLEKKSILLLTPIFGELKKNGLDDCPLKDRCEIIVDKSQFPQASAVVFHDPSTVYPAKASDDQKMVIYTMESAPNVVQRWENYPRKYIYVSKFTPFIYRYPYSFIYSPSWAICFPCLFCIRVHPCLLYLPDLLVIINLFS